MSMRRILGVLILMSVGAVDMLACGDKFLIAGRGTRYQRPKNARAASVLIYNDPASAVAAAFKKAKVESLLKLEGHRATKVDTLQELSAIVASGRYDVILTANSDSATVRRLVQASPDAAIVIAVDDLVKNRSFLEAIDQAVQQRDHNLKKIATRF
jgi:DNA-binding NarL/FixJ family response regulator